MGLKVLYKLINYIKIMQDGFFREESKESKWDLIIDFVLFLTILIMTLIILKPFLTALVFAVLTAYALKPLVDLINKIVRIYRLSLFVALLILIIPTGAFIYYAAEGTAPIIQKTNEIIISFNEVLEKISLKASEYPILNALNIPEYIKNTQSIILEFSSSIKASLISSFQNIPGIVISVAIYLLATYYFIVESEALNKHYENLLSSLSKRRQIMFNSLFKGLKNALDVLVVSYITLTIIVTVLAYIIYFAFSVPYALLWAILTGLFGLLPILGSWMVYGGVSLYMYLKGNELAAIIILIYGLVILNLLPELVLRPALSSYKTKVHPLVIILGFFGGPAIFGFSGFILGPIIMVVSATVIKEYYEHYILQKKIKNNHRESR